MTCHSRHGGQKWLGLVQVSLVVLFLGMALAGRAQLVFTTNNGAITITGYTGPGGTLVIPAMTNGYPVTVIGDYALQYKNTLTNVVIPDTVFTIGNYAFASCFRLTNITFGASITSIGDYAFNACTSLTNIVLPDQLSHIGMWAFGDCYGMASINIPDHVLTIGDNAFQSCDHATNVLLGGSVTNFSLRSFSGCSALTTVAVNPANPVFSSFENVIFDKNKQAIVWCFPGKTGSYVIPDSVVSIGDGAFVNSALTNIVTGEGVKNIGDSAFAGAYVINMVIGNAVTNIGDYAFNNRFSALTTVSLGSNVLAIGSHAFDSCSSLKAIDIPDSVLRIKSFAFNKCSALGRVNFGKHVASIESEAFIQCSSLANLVIPDSVTNLEFIAFGYCSSLTNVVIGGGLTSIPDQAFLFCNQLSSVKINSGVAGIGSYAFAHCWSLTNIALPAGLTNIGGLAFLDCPALSGVFFAGDASMVDPSVFQADDNATSYYLPGRSGWGDFALATGRPAVLWNPQVQAADGTFGITTNGFCFNITGTADIPIVVEASAKLADEWLPVQTGNLANGQFYFCDPAWRQFPGRLYRVRSP